MDSRGIALLGGSWSSNIGNAFYNLGAQWLLRQLGDDIWFVPESPRWKQTCDSDFDLVGHLACKLVILVGPCLNLKLKDVYATSFRRLYDRGVRVGYMSVGMSLYDEGEANAVKEFFDEFPPAFIATRDDLTYELISTRVSCPTYSGLCTSMFLNDAYDPPGLVAPPYVVLNFDSREPVLSFDQSGIATVKSLPKTLFGQKSSPAVTSVCGMDVVRTSNSSIDDGYKVIYERPNTYHSDIPWGYCSILKNAECVYSERVHTCAATVIYGNAAQFVAQSRRSFEKRSLLFRQIGLQDIFERPVRIDFDVVNPLKQKMKEFLQRVLN